MVLLYHFVFEVCTQKILGTRDSPELEPECPNSGEMEEVLKLVIVKRKSQLNTYLNELKHTHTQY